METALLSGLIIAIVLIILLLMGVPISVSLGIASIFAILPIMNFESEFFQEYPYLHL